MTVRVISCMFRAYNNSSDTGLLISRAKINSTHLSVPLIVHQAIPSNIFVQLFLQISWSNYSFKYLGQIAAFAF